MGRSLQSPNHSYRGINRRRKVSGSWWQPQRKPAPASLDLCAYPEKGFSASGAVKADEPISGCGSEETSPWVGGRFYGSCQFNFGTIHKKSHFHVISKEAENPVRSNVPEEFLFLGRYRETKIFCPEILTRLTVWANPVPVTGVRQIEVWGRKHEPCLQVRPGDRAFRFPGEFRCLRERCSFRLGFFCFQA